MARRQHLTLTLMAVLVFLGLTYMMSTGGSTSEHSPMRISDEGYSRKDHTSSSGSGSSGSGSSGSSTTTTTSTSSGSNPAAGISESILKGGSIAPKLENATAKAELGRASWKLFHTMMARFPEEPTADDSLALKTYIQLFARLYPCGDCASHFQKLLGKYPPQTSSRNAAAGWACFVHNEVNKRLHKEQFDCNKIGDFYDCGCGEEGKEGKDGKEKGKGKAEAHGGGEEAGKKKGEELKGREGVTVEKEEGLTRGG